MKKLFKSLLMTTVASAVSLNLSATEILDGIESAPNLVTVGAPDDPLYANAGDNLRNGVGSIFIQFSDGGGFICTASAISKTHILTAAHCVRNAGSSLTRLRFVLTAGLDSPMILDASSFAVHPWYDALNPYLGAFAHGDIAVVELAEPLPDEIETYELYRTPDEFGSETRHYGHGRSGKGNKGATGDADFFYARTGLNQYEEVLEPFLGTGIEDQLLHDFDSGGRKHNAMEWWFSSVFVCGNENGTNPGQARDGKCMSKKDGSHPDFKGYGALETGVAPGDSGGPGFINGKIAGVHSFGFTHGCDSISNGTDFTCGLDSSFGEMSGDTRVSYHAGWVDAAVSGAFPSTSIPEAMAPESNATDNAQASEVSALVGEKARFFVENVVSGQMSGKAKVQ
ncbi:trypsin-like serine protease [Alteromonas facilis]|uniref:trypsin-like serine protease n=1 Tax=Alteromonas facilis TaxID=2048004 RepID=UPI000C28667B|nr:trypsin-like serine protease [Alteromonas facilis]